MKNEEHENRNKPKKNIDLHIFVLSSSQTEANANVLQLGCCWSHEIGKVKKITTLEIVLLLVRFMPSLESPNGNIVPLITITCSVFHTSRLIFPFHFCGQFRLLLFILLYPTGVSGPNDAGIILSFLLPSRTIPCLCS